jgi:SAM-dependent methyltransferase
MGRGDTLDVVNAGTRRAYNLAAERYHELFHDELNGKPFDRELLDRFAAGFHNDSLVCDAGCGPSGHIGRYLFDKGIPVLGVDISDRCVELARRYNPAMRFERGDIGNLAVEGETFDGILAYYSIIDTPKVLVGRLFREFRRVLKADGRLLVAVKEGATEGYLTELLGFETEIYFSLFTPDEIRRFFEDAGFRVELLEQRAPYDSEINAGRIFALGRKV